MIAVFNIGCDVEHKDQAEKSFAIDHMENAVPVEG